MPIVDPALDALGYAVLSAPGSRARHSPRCRTLPVVPWTRFNDTVVMGGLVAGLALWVPVFLSFIVLVKAYRAKLRERIANEPARAGPSRRCRSSRPSARRSAPIGGASGLGG